MTIESLKEAARRHEQSEEWIKALDLYLQAIDQQSDEDEPDIALYNRVGDLQVRLGDIEGAVGNYDTAIQLYRDAELPNNAIAVCRKIIRHDPRRPAPFLRMGQIRASQGFLVDARQNFLTYAEMKQAAGDTDEAFRALEEFVGLAPKDVDTRLFLADQLIGQERPEDAILYLEQTYMVLEESGETEAAQDVFERIRTIDPEHPEPGPEWSADELVSAAENTPSEGAETEGEESGEEGEPAGFERTSLGQEFSSADPADLELEVPLGGLERGEPEGLNAEDAGLTEVDEPDGVRADEVDGLEHQSVADGAGSGFFSEEIPAEAEDPDWLEVDRPHGGMDAGGDEDSDLEFEEGYEEGALGDIQPEASIVEGMESDVEMEPDLEFSSEGEDDGAAPLPLLGEVEGNDGEGVTREDGWDLDDGSSDEDERRIEATQAERSMEEAVADASGERLAESEEGLKYEEEGLEYEEGLEGEEGVPVDEDETFLVEDLAAELGEDEADASAGRRRALRDRVERDVTDAEAWRHLGESLYEDGEEEEGRAALERAHETYAESGDPEKAIRVVRELLLREPHRMELRQRVVEYAHRTKERTLLIQAFLELADGLRASGDTQKAEAVYQQVLSLDPSNLRATEALGRSRPGVGIEPASGESGSGSSRGRDYVDLGSMVLDSEDERTTRWVVPAELPSGDEQADFSRMLSQFKEKVAENIASDDVTAHYDLGTAFMEMGLLDEAIGEFQQALRAQPRSLPTFEMLGQCFLDKGEPEVAIRTLERGTRLPTPVEDDLLGIYYFLARAHEEVGNTASAREFYEKVFSLDINFRDVTERLRALR
ncbi:MAG: tetratricopeptide repeat protein [Gemmatimonadota bacterium]